MFFCQKFWKKAVASACGRWERFIVFVVIFDVVLVSLIVVQSSWHGERGVLVSSIVVPSRGHRGGVLVSLVVVHVDPRQPHGEVVVVFHHVQDVLLPKVVVKLRQPVEAVLIIGVLVSN